MQMDCVFCPVQAYYYYQAKQRTSRYARGKHRRDYIEFKSKVGEVAEEGIVFFLFFS